jgi:hypothetical protein
MAKAYFVGILAVGISALAGAPAFGADSPAPGLHIDAQLDTPEITDSGSAEVAREGQPVTIKMKNGVVRMIFFDQTERTIRIHTELFQGPEGRPPALYNSTFLTNLNMDAELREMKQDGTLLYKLRITPHYQQAQK